MRRIALLAVLVTLAVSVVGCSGGPGSPSTPNPSPGYTASGLVTDSKGTPIPNTSVVAAGSTNATTLTTSDGKWTLSGLDGAVTITVSKEGWSFSPESYTISSAKVGLDFVGEGKDGYIDPDVYPLIKANEASLALVDCGTNCKRWEWSVTVTNHGHISHYWIHIRRYIAGQHGVSLFDFYSDNPLPRNVSETRSSSATYYGGGEPDYTHFEFIVHSMINNQWVVTDSIIVYPK